MTLEGVERANERAWCAHVAVPVVFLVLEVLSLWGARKQTCLLLLAPACSCLLLA